MSRPQVFVLNTNTKREVGRKAQLGNIAASTAVADIIRTCLGPRAMMKMLLDPMGTVVITADGNAILREIDVAHPAAKNMIELSRAQDESVGDGTTSVIVLGGEMMRAAEPLLTRNMHPTVIVNAYFRALEDSIAFLESMTTPIDISNQEQMLKLILTSVGTKFTSRWSELMCRLALDAVLTVFIEREDGKREVDIKHYARVEKIAGGSMEDSYIFKGAMLNKDVTHAKMRRTIKNPRIILLDCSLEFKKSESVTNIGITKTSQFTEMLRAEEQEVEALCNAICAHRPDLVITEKGISDHAQHIFVKNNVTALRRTRKTDMNRIARACGATICHRPDEIKETDVGKGCGLFDIRKIGDEYYSFIEDCPDAKACTILLRGPSRDALMEVERNLIDAMNAARNVVHDPRLLPGGGATEMALSKFLDTKAKSLGGVVQYPYQAVALALEVIPRTLAQNSGASVIRSMTALRAKHDAGFKFTGLNGLTGELADMAELGVLEPFVVKMQCLKTAIESACMMLRIDDILSGVKKSSGGAGGMMGGSDGAEYEAPEE